MRARCRASRGIRPTKVIPVAIATRTAHEWGIGVGTRMRLDAVGQGPSYAQPQPFVVEIAGTYAPKDAADPFWGAEQRMVRAAGLPSPDGGSIPEIALIVAPEAYGPFGAALYPLPEDYRSFRNSPSEISSGLVHEWRLTSPGAGGDPTSPRSSRDCATCWPAINVLSRAPLR